MVLANAASRCAGSCRDKAESAVACQCFGRCRGELGGIVCGVSRIPRSPMEVSNCEVSSCGDFLRRSRTTDVLDRVALDPSAEEMRGLIPERRSISSAGTMKFPNEWRRTGESVGNACFSAIHVADCCSFAALPLNPPVVAVPN